MTEEAIVICISGSEVLEAISSGKEISSNIVENRNGVSDRSPSDVGEGNRKLAVTAIILDVSRMIFVVFRDSKLNMADVVEGADMVNSDPISAVTSGKMDSCGSDIISDENIAISDIEIVNSAMSLVVTVTGGPLRLC